MTENEENEIIKTKGVKVNFGDFWALKGIDITVRTGEIIVILGPSGSGKSTFIRTLNRLQPHSGGTIEVDGITIDEETSVADLKYIRSEIGFVFQQFELFPHLTIMENVTLAPMKVKGMTKSQAEEKAMELLERVGIPEQAYKYPSGLSGGQQQRVGLCRALMLRPQMLLLDEPFSAIDPITRADLHAHFAALQLHEGVSTLLVTHDLREAVKLAGFLVIMADGQIVQSGKTTEVLDAPANSYVRQLLDTHL